MTSSIFELDRGKAATAAAAALWLSCDEPRSVLYPRPSPSPSASSNAGDVASLAGETTAAAAAHGWAPAGEDEWGSPLPPPPFLAGAGTGGGVGGRGFDVPLGQEQTFLRWFMGETGQSPSTAGFGIGVGVSSGLPPLPAVHTAPLVPGYDEPPEEKAVPFVPFDLLGHGVPSFSTQEELLSPSVLLPPQPKRHRPLAGAAGPKLPPLPLPQPPVVLPLQPPPAQSPKSSSVFPGDGSELVDQLLEAAKLTELGDPFGAREILARLNHRLPAAAAGTPLLRSAFYFNEALLLAVSGAPAPPPAAAAATASDAVLKLSAHKAFLDASPVLQFAHFTSVQAVLDELSGARCVHVIDFDIGFGAQWPSLMQEMVQCHALTGASPPSFQVTAFVSSSTHSAIELHLIQDNLAGFAGALGIAFQFNILCLDTFDSSDLLTVSPAETVVVNLPSSCFAGVALPAIFRIVQHLRPKIALHVDDGYGRPRLPFAAYLFRAFKSCVLLLDSLDAAIGAGSEAAGSIERFIVGPRVRTAVLDQSRSSAPADWGALLASAGFTPVQFSSFAETQAEWLLKWKPSAGFSVDKQPGTLGLCWQGGELVSVSAWRC